MLSMKDKTPRAMELMTDWLRTLGQPGRGLFPRRVLLCVVENPGKAARNSAMRQDVKPVHNGAEILEQSPGCGHIFLCCSKTLGGADSNASWS